MKCTGGEVPNASPVVVTFAKVTILGAPAVNRHDAAAEILDRIDALQAALDAFVAANPADHTADDCLGAGWGLQQLRGAVDCSL